MSDRDRHLFHFGTETTIGTPNTQDPMFVRFSNQEDLNTYAPTSTNTAGTFRLDTGNKIVAAIQGKDYVFCLTDQAAYVIQFVVHRLPCRTGWHKLWMYRSTCRLLCKRCMWWMSAEGGFCI